MALKFPGLTIVRLATFVSNMVAIPAISEFVCALRNLESLVVSGLNRAALLHIARLPGLRYLWLMSTEKPIPIFSFQPPAGSLHFPILTTLEIETMEHASILLKFMGKCSLVEIRVISRGRSVPYTTMIAKEFYSALATHCSRSSLQEITV
jgi:hypothetical protein